MLLCPRFLSWLVEHLLRRLYLSKIKNVLASNDPVYCKINQNRGYKKV